MRAAVTSFLLACALVVAGCGQKSSSTRQALRTCVNRWNQGNMIGQGPAPANIAFRRPVARERARIALSAHPQCIVAIDAHDGTWTCVLTGTGAYWCPPRHEPTGPPLTDKNATIDRRGSLELDSPLQGTHATPPLPWQRYPHIAGYIEPWTSRGTLRGGLRFVGHGRGRCFVVDETARGALSCLTRTFRRYDACFPQRRTWHVGDPAACGGLGDTHFMRWTITGR